MKSTRLPFQILSINKTNKLGLVFKGFFQRIAKVVPGLKYDLIKANFDINENDYVGFTFFNSKIIAMISFVFFFILSLIIAKRETWASFQIAFLSSFAIFILFFIVMLKYPAIKAGKISEEIDKNLIYGLKDLLLQISSGVMLDKAISNVAEANYGRISIEFKKVCKDIKTGVPMIKALEEMALHTKSKFLKRTVWQIVNTVKAGSNVHNALRTVINELVTEQRNSIKNYSKELNLWTLIYMLFAVAIPSIGGTLLIILSGFAGAGISKASFILFLIMGFLIQIALIEFIKSRRPAINI